MCADGNGPPANAPVKEIWKLWPLQSRYEVSNYGRFRSAADERYRTGERIKRLGRDGRYNYERPGGRTGKVNPRTLLTETFGTACTRCLRAGWLLDRD